MKKVSENLYFLTKSQGNVCWKVHINPETVSGGFVSRPPFLSLLEIFKFFSPIHSTVAYAHTWHYMGVFCVFEACTIGNSSEQSWLSNKETTKPLAYD